MASGKALEYVEQLAAEKPALAEDLSELSSLYQRKLWHQLTLKLEECSQKPAFNQGDLFVRLYNGFIADFGAKLNLLRLAHLAVHASKQVKDPAAAVAFLKTVIERIEEMKLPRSDEPLLYLRMHVAQQQLEMGQVAECKAAVEDGAAALERLPEPDPSVSAAVHYVSSLYYKLKKDYAKFYRSSMQVRPSAQSGSACSWSARRGRSRCACISGSSTNTSRCCCARGCCCYRTALAQRLTQPQRSTRQRPTCVRLSLMLTGRPPPLHLPTPNPHQYLAFVSSDSLPQEFKVPLAVDIALAALLGEGVYGFAQLLMHPIVKVLQEGSYAWLGEMLEVFNRWVLRVCARQLNCCCFTCLEAVQCRLQCLHEGAAARNRCMICLFATAVLLAATQQQLHAIMFQMANAAASQESHQLAP